MSWSSTDSEPSQSIVLQRDRLLILLRQLCRDSKRNLLAAAHRLDARIRRMIAAEHEKKRTMVRMQLALLPVAKRLVLQRDKMESRSQLVLDPAHPPPGFDPMGIMPNGGHIPVWMLDAYRAVGKMDFDIAAMVHNLAGHLRNAQSGRIGEYRIAKGIDLRRTRPLDAYVFALSQLWAKGRYTREETRRELDPRRIKNTAATPWQTLANISLDLTSRDPEAILRAEEWWDTALVLMLVIDPEYRVKSTALKQLPPWTLPNEGLGRDQIMPIWLGRGDGSTRDDLWFWVERTCLNLSALVPHGRHDVDSPGSMELRALVKGLVEAISRLQAQLPGTSELTLPGSIHNRAKERAAELRRERATGDGDITTPAPDTPSIPTETSTAPPSSLSPPNSPDNVLPITVRSAAMQAGAAPDLLSASPDAPADLSDFDEVKIHAATAQLSWRNNVCSFGVKEWTLVSHLFKNSGQSFDATTLRGLIWPPGTPHAKGKFASLVDRVRVKLRAASFPPWVLPSTPRGSYRLVISRDVT